MNRFPATVYFIIFCNFYKYTCNPDHLVTELIISYCTFVKSLYAGVSISRTNNYSRNTLYQNCT